MVGEFYCNPAKFICLMGVLVRWGEEEEYSSGVKINLACDDLGFMES